MSKILLINICLRPDVEKILYPVGLSYIASAIYRSSHEVSILDMDAERLTFEAVEEKLKTIEFDAVGLGCIVTGYKIVKKLSSLVKKVNKDALVIVGNSVATSIPETLLKNTDVDVAVIGEGDKTIVEILNCLERNGDFQKIPGIYYKKEGRIFSTSKREVYSDIDDIPLPEWHLFDMETYLSMSNKYVSEPYPIPKEKIRACAVNTARGCPFDCTFCYHVFKNDKYRTRTPNNILSEISELQNRYGVNYINFWDELTLYSRRQTEEFVNEILRSDLNFFWTGACRGDLFALKDVDLLKKVKQSGCIGLGYSLESANAAILKRMNKKLNPINFVEQKRALDSVGIVTWTSLVIGYPGETEDTLKETFDLCYLNDIYPSAGYLLPQPGTPVYRYARENGYIPNEEKYLMDMGDRQDLRINLTRIPQQRLEKLVNDHLSRIRDKLRLNISDKQLLKSGKYRVKVT